MMKKTPHSAHSRAFGRLQQRLNLHYEEIFLDDLAEKTVVVVPSLTLDREILKSLRGAIFYEERMLCMLMLLRMPRTHIIYLTSVPIDDSIIDYYLHMLPGITGYHARQRLALMSCYDASRISLTEKILQRPRLIQKIKALIKSPQRSHLVCFNETEAEKQLALQLDIPVYGSDPDLAFLGNKTGSRQLFRKLNLPLPAGIEGIQSEEGIACALAQLKQENPALRKAVVKINDGFSGDGNAIFYYPHDSPCDAARIQSCLPHQLRMVAENVSYELYLAKFISMGGIVEVFIEGDIKESPSVQCRITPRGDCDVISTHDQLLGGESGQVFLGATFPARAEYNLSIAEMGKKVAEELRQHGVLGRFGVDFISVKQPHGWEHYAIEINLRKGGTTHPFMMLQFLTDGRFDWQKGVYTTPNGQQRCYFASDNVVNPRLKGLSPQDLIDIAIGNRIQYDATTQCGVTFHMIGALSQYGKLGLVCIGKSTDDAWNYYIKTIEALEAACS